jgi:hypothetical protein
MKNRFHTLLFGFLFLTLSSLSAQQLLSTAGTKVELKDSVNHRLIDLPKLIPVVSVDTVTPYYRLFYIYGDGGFDFSKTANGVEHNAPHRYPVANPSASTNYTARVYSLSTYSNGLPPPPRMQSNPFPSPTDPAIPPAVQQKSVVDTNRLLKIFPHAEAKKGEPLVYVVAFKNNTRATLGSATLYLLYEGEIREISTSKKGEAVISKPGNFSRFPVTDVLVQTNNAFTRVNLYGSQLNAPLLNQYQKMLAFNVSQLAPGQEGHVFVEYTVDSLNFTTFNGKNRAETDFTAILVSHDANFVPPTPLDNQQSAFLNQLIFDTTMARANAFPSDGVYNYLQPQDLTTFEQNGGDNGEVPAGGTVVDLFTNTISFVKEHDPNFLRAEACPCPQDQQRRKLFLTLHAENDGLGTVSSVFFDLALPPGLLADDIVTTPVSYHPYRPDLNSDDHVNFTKIDDSHVRWTFTNQFLRSVQELGIGDERTYVELAFLAFTDADPVTLDSVLQACVRFNDLTNEALCTYPVPVLMISSEDSATAELLNCETCKEDPGTNSTAWPWWWWLVLILIFLLVFVVFWLRRSR